MKKKNVEEICDENCHIFLGTLRSNAVALVTACGVPGLGPIMPGKPPETLSNPG
jgi:hypothetical protein